MICCLNKNIVKIKAHNDKNDNILTKFCTGAGDLWGGKDARLRRSAPRKLRVSSVTVVMALFIVLWILFHILSAWYFKKETHHIQYLIFNNYVDIKWI